MNNSLCFDIEANWIFLYFSMPPKRKKIDDITRDENPRNISQIEGYGEQQN